MPSSYTALTPAAFLIGPVLLTVGGVNWGVSRGGLKVESLEEWRQAEFDGKRSDLVGNGRKVATGVRVSGTFLEFSATNIGRLAHATPVVAGSITTITPPSADTLLPLAGYVTDVRMVAKLGDGSFLRLWMPVAFVTYTLDSPDKSEVGAALTFTARVDLTVAGNSTDTPPYVWERVAAPVVAPPAASQYVVATHQKALGGSSIAFSSLNAYNSGVQPTIVTGDTVHAIDSYGAIDAIQLGWGEDTNTGQSAGHWNILGVEVIALPSGTRTAITFNGGATTSNGPQSDASTAAGRMLVSDLVPIALAAEQQFIIREARSLGTVTDYRLDCPGNDTLGASNARRDGVMFTNTIGNSGAVPQAAGFQSIGPRMIFGHRANGNPRSFAAMGDSITQGTIAASFIDCGMGDYYRFFGSGTGDGLQTTPRAGVITAVLGLGQAAEVASFMTSGASWAETRWEMLRRAQATDLFLMYGTNDIFAGTAPATVFANLRAIAQRARNTTYNVQRVILFTIPPRTLNNSSGSHGANSFFEGPVDGNAGAGSNWAALNALIRATGQIGTSDPRTDADFAGYIDLQTFVSTGTDVCRWSDPSNQTPDGTHPNNDPSSASAVIPWKCVAAKRSAILALGT
jgi:lysophospholipase L1-like esterase